MTSDFRLLWAAQSASALGSQVTALALPLAAATLLDAGPVAVGVLSAAATAPALLLSLPSGVWVDRARRRRPLLVAADLVAAAALLAVPAAAVLELLTLGLLAAVALVVGGCQVLHRTAFAAHLPDVVADADLPLAGGRLRATDSAAQVAGPAAAGGLVTAAGPAVAVLLDAASFLLSAALLRRVRAPETPGGATAGALWTQVREGAVAVRGDGRLRACAAAAANVNLAGSAALALLLLFATEELGLSAAAVGLVLSAGGVGALLGALAAPRLAARWGAGRTVVAAAAGLSVCLASVPLAGGPAPVAVSVLVAGELLGGVAVMLFDVTVGVVVVRAAPRALLGRVWATLGFLTQGAKPVGAVLGGLLGAAVGLRPALAVVALVASTSVTWTWWSPLRERESLAVAA